MTILDARPTTQTDAAIELVERHAAHNYSPLPVVAASAEGAWITDVDGRRYLDCLAAYSAVNFGHRNPEIIATAHAQLDTVTLVSRAFHAENLGRFCAALAQLCGKDMVLPMNSGAEAVESGLKVARKWGADVKGVPAGHANIIVADNNFHGRTISIVSFSSDPTARDGFGPFTPGFRSVPFGDAAALARAIDDNTVAVLLEPIQGEAGVIVPPDDYLPAVRALCDERNVLMIADEIQSGLARTGYTFACDHWGVVPDVYLLGKALGGGVVPLSAMVADRDILGVLHPGEHGSTFGGNPLAAAIGTTVVSMLATGEFQARAAELGAQLHRRLKALIGDGVRAVRGLGLWAGVDIEPALATGKDISLRLAERGLLVKDTHGSTLRFAPPLVITEQEIDWAIDQFAFALAEAAS
ncbi:ornithine--oxo-acid transaminase [Mycobacterium sp. IS-2888]|uniref:ornithine--oxo-acid transaminase n=1 Tax=unclassified Mycobacterium TaxID=2642494 RepID=UPI00096D1E5D|nr:MULTISPECIES: ornithine--oxo-acid transaminase [unclassified Mycobacterium]OMC39199.1 ornithine--oxo-acid transaminase [Mycobacterium sp. IS-1264]OMC48714.1 ornithine--oxo-acid transaminase [Mycobacterium sp. IS-2888]